MKIPAVSKTTGIRFHGTVLNSTLHTGGILFLLIPQIQMATDDLLHFLKDDLLTGSGGEILQTGLFTGLERRSQATLINEFLLQLGAAAGNPCRVLRPITDKDAKYRGKQIEEKQQP